MTEIDKYFCYYWALTTLAWLFYANKPKHGDIGVFGGQMLKWWLFGLWLVVYFFIGLYSRNKLRWLKDKWVCVTYNQLWKQMIKRPEPI